MMNEDYETKYESYLDLDKQQKIVKFGFIATLVLFFISSIWILIAVTLKEQIPLNYIRVLHIAFAPLAILTLCACAITLIIYSGMNKITDIYIHPRGIEFYRKAKKKTIFVSWSKILQITYKEYKLVSSRIGYRGHFLKLIIDYYENTNKKKIKQELDSVTKQLEIQKKIIDTIAQRAGREARKIKTIEGSMIFRRTRKSRSKL